jgi:hypothetical protein
VEKWRRDVGYVWGQRPSEFFLSGTILSLNLNLNLSLSLNLNLNLNLSLSLNLNLKI